MRKITFVLLLLGIWSSVIAQSNLFENIKERDRIENKNSQSKKKYDNYEAPRVIMQSNNIKSRAEVLSEDFSSGVLPTGWQNIDNQGGGEVWYFDNPKPRTLNSTTGANGFAVFDSDYNGGGGGAEDADLITPPIDCSALTNVILSFEHYFYAGSSGAAELMVSGDNGATWNSIGSWGSASTANAELFSQDISTYAAGKSQVLIKWNWKGDYSWYWAVDDVSVYEPNPYAFTLGVSAGESVGIDSSYNYTVSLSNIGTSNDIYDISISSQEGWDYFILNNLDQPITEMPIDAGKDTSFIVRVSVPSTAAPDDKDTLTVTVTSQADNTLTESKTITTTAIKAVLTIGDSENFETYPPTFWAEATGLLDDPTNFLALASSYWSHKEFANTGTDKAASINVFGSSKKDWLITPSVDLGTENNAQIEFDLALTKYNNTDPATLDPTARFAVVISTDNGTTWSETNALLTYKQSDAISNTGDHKVITLENYTGLVKIGFYAEQTDWGADLDLFVDNFKITEMPNYPYFADTSFYYALNTQEDVVGKIIWRSATSMIVDNNGTQLVNGADYTLVDNGDGTSNITFKGSYLSNQMQSVDDTLVLKTTFNTTDEIYLTIVPSYQVVEGVDQVPHYTTGLGVAFSELALPQKVKVELNFGDSVDVNVNWFKGDYDKDLLGTYTIYGELETGNILNTYNHKAQMEVVVKKDIYSMPYTQDFEGNWLAEGFSIHNYGDANKWEHFEGGGTHSGTGCAIIQKSTSAHDDWLITPKISISGDNPLLGAWYLSGSLYSEEPYDILISTTTTDTSEFTILKKELNPSTTWGYRTNDLSAYAGQDIYIAFRSTTTNKKLLAIDDIKVYNSKKLSFNVLGFNNIPLKGATIDMDDRSLTTDDSGTAEFIFKENGKYFYEILANKYMMLKDTADINSANTTISHTLDTAYVVNFIVLNDTAGPVDAEVYCKYLAEDIKDFTDSDGKAEFGFPTGTYNYSIEAIGYNATSGTFTVVNDTLTVNVTMSNAPATFSFNEDYNGELNFPKTLVDFETEVAISFGNIGKDTIRINPTDITLTGADADQFELKNIAATTALGEGNDSTVYIKFKPTSEGTKTATLQIVDNIAKATHQLVLSADAFHAPTLPFNEDFEGGSGYNWYFAQEGQKNKWFIGTAEGSEGNSTAFVSNNGVNNFYSTNSSSRSYLYTDVKVPTGVNDGDYVLSFDWRCNGEGGYSDYDYGKVFLIDPSETPKAGFDNLSSSIGLYNTNPNWKTESYNIPTAKFDTTIRIVFFWKNDYASGVQPPMSIDNVYVGTPNTEAEILSFDIDEVESVTTVVDDTIINVAVGIGTDLTQLTPSISVSQGAVISPANGVMQDFSDTVLYTVTSQDGSTTQEYHVVATAKYEVKFVITDGQNPAVNVDILFGTETLTTNANGIVKAIVDAGDYNYSISGQDDWVDYSGTVSVTNNSVTENLALTPKYKLTFAKQGEGTLAATIDGTGITSDNYFVRGTRIEFAAQPATDLVLKEWILNDEPDTVNFTGTYIISSLSETTDLKVKFAKTEASLSKLLVDGVEVNNFDSATYQYVVDIPCGSANPVVSAVAYDSDATIDATNQADLSIGDTTSVIKVTAEDGKTILKYQVKFVEAGPDFYEITSSDVTTSSFKLNLSTAYTGLTVSDFTLNLTQVTSTVIPITSVTEAQAGLEYTFATGPMIEGKGYDLNVVGMDECTEFTENALVFVPSTTELLVVTTSPKNQVENVEIDAEIEVLFDEQITEIDLSGITIVPAPSSMTPVINASSNGILINHSVLGNHETVTVKIPAGAVKGNVSNDNNDEYTWSFTTREVSTNSLLSNLTIDGFDVEEFDPNAHFYTRTLPYETTTLPIVGAVKADAKATMGISQITQLPDTAKVTVTAEDGVTSTIYSVEFLREANNDATLAGINIGTTPVSGFSPVILVYDTILAPGTTVVPTVTATPTDANANVNVAETDTLPGTTTITVTAEDGTTKIVYLVNFDVEISTDATLADLKVDGTTISGFSSDTYNYTVELPYGTTTVPQVTAVTSFAGATHVVTDALSLPGTTEVEVTAEDGTTVLTYSVLFTLAASSDATLSDIKVDDVSIADFASDTYSYTVTLPYGTTTVPNVTAFTTDINATKTVTQAGSLSETATIVTTAQDGTTHLTYTVAFAVEAPNTDATLASLKVNGLSVDGFSSDVLSYTVILPYGTTDIPVVTATANDENATYNLSNATSLPGTTTVVVTAQDGTTQLTYSVVFEIQAASTDATLSDLKVNGVTIEGFSSDVFTYSVAIPSTTTEIPTILGTLNDANANMVVSQVSSLPGTATIVVTAEDGTTSNTYSVEFYNVFTVTINVTDGQDVPVADASVFFNGETIVTNANGVAVFQSVEAGTDLPITISKDSYQTYNGTLNVDGDENETIKIIFISIIDNLFAEVSVYPNPTSDKVIISGNFDSKFNLNIKDVQGRVIVNRFFESEKEIIDLSQERSGIYFITISTEGKSATYKVVKF